MVRPGLLIGACALLLAAAGGAVGSSVPVAHIERITLRLVSHGSAAVGVRLTMRVCGGARGSSRVPLVESLSGTNGHVVASHVRVERLQQRGHCVSRTFRWRIGRQFIGVGHYRIFATVIDSHGLKSAPRTVVHTTTD